MGLILGLAILALGILGICCGVKAVILGVVAIGAFFAGIKER